MRTSWFYLFLQHVLIFLIYFRFSLCLKFYGARKFFNKKNKEVQITWCLLDIQKFDMGVVTDNARCILLIL